MIHSTSTYKTLGHRVRLTRLNYRLSDLLLAVLVVAVGGTTYKLIGGDLLLWTVMVGSITGGVVAMFGARSFRSGMLIVFHSLLGAMTLSIVTTFAAGYELSPADDSLDKLPLGYTILLWYGFMGAAIGTSVSSITLGAIRWGYERAGMCGRQAES